MSEIRRIRAKIQFLRTEEGGRHSPVRSGYRPHFTFEQDPPSDFDGVIHLEGREWASPGDEVTAWIAFAHPEYAPGCLKPDATFTAREGARVVGRVTVLELIREPSRSRPAHTG